MESEKKYYGMVDILRLVFALLVPMVHTMAFKSINENMRIVTSMGICRIAVPFFFLVSGYFLYDRIKSKEEPKKTLKKLLRLYAFWVLVEFISLCPFVIGRMKSMPIETSIRAILLLGCVGSLWYVSSLIIAVFLSSPLLKKDKVMIVLVIGFILYLFGASGDTYYGLFDNSLIEWYKSKFFLPQIGVTESIFFVALGCVINKYNFKDKIKNSGVLSILGVALVLVETLILNTTGIAQDTNLYLSVIIAGPLILIWGLNYKKDVSKEFSKACRDYSVGIYCCHQILMLYIQNFIQNTMIVYLITIVLSFIVITGVRKTKLRKVLL